jgi:hypothetical protein
MKTWYLHMKVLHFQSAGPHPWANTFDHGSNERIFAEDTSLTLPFIYFPSISL